MPTHVRAAALTMALVLIAMHGVAAKTGPLFLAEARLAEFARASKGAPARSPSVLERIAEITRHSSEGIEKTLTFIKAKFPSSLHFNPRGMLPLKSVVPTAAPGLRGGSPAPAHGASSGAPPKASNSLRVHFFASAQWDARPVYLHYSRDGGKTWSVKRGDRQAEEHVCESGEEDPEMQRLGHARPAGGGWRFADIENVRGKVQFVFNDGAGLWDSTPVGEEERTFYEADRAGAVCVKDGRLTVVGGGSPVLVVTDLDGTYVGDADAVAAFNDEWERQLAPRGSVLVFNTGRSIESARALIASAGLLVPTAIIGSVGTEIWWAQPDGSFAHDADWDEKLESLEGWSREAVERAAEQWLSHDVMHWRPEDEQNRFKAVFGVRAGQVSHIVAEMRKALAAEGKSAKLVSSGHGDWNYLDVVCEAAGKHEALLHVRARLGFPSDRTVRPLPSAPSLAPRLVTVRRGDDQVACGDSGNDILMFEGAERGVVVGNAQEGLLEWVRKQGQQPRSANAGDRIFCAS